MDDKLLWIKIKKNILNNGIFEEKVYNEFISNAKAIIYNKNNKKTLSILAKTYLAKKIISLYLESLKKIIDETTKNNYEVIVLLEKKQEFNTTEFNDGYKPHSKILFRDIFIAEFNNDAITAIKSIVNQNYLKLLFIFGPQGLGKTTMLTAAKNEFKEKKILIMSLGEFIEINLESLKNKLNKHDALFIDDIDFLKNNHKNYKKIFKLIEYCFKKEISIVITSKKHPYKIIWLKNDIKPLIDAGLTIKIKQPKNKDILAIINKNLSFNNVNYLIDSKTAHYLTTNYSHNLRMLKDVLKTILFNKHSENKNSIDINFDNTLAILEQKSGHKEKINTLYIKRIICKYFCISMEQLTSNSRIKRLVFIRHLTMYLIKTILDKSYLEISNEFNKKNHTTAINACKKIEKELEKDASSLRIINELKRLINSKKTIIIN